MKKFLVLSLSDVVFIMLTNVKMRTIVGILTFISRINGRVQLVWAWKKFDNLRAMAGIPKMHVKIANWEDPDQTVFLVAVWSGSELFVYIFCSQFMFKI